MTKVAATEFTRNFSRFREVVQRVPVAVTSHDRITGYFVSTRDFAEYQLLKARAGTAVLAGELDDETLGALAEARMDRRHEQLNDLLDD